MPVWKGQVAVQERDGASGLWGDEVCPGASSIEVALQAIRTILVDSTAPPEMTVDLGVTNACPASQSPSCG